MLSLLPLEWPYYIMFFLNFENHHISNNTLCKKVRVYKCTYKRIHVFGIIIWMHRLNNFRKHCINWSLLDFGWQIFWKFLFSSSTNDHFNFFDCKCVVWGYLFRETWHRTVRLQQPRDPPLSASVCSPHWFSWRWVLLPLGTPTYTSPGGALWSWQRRQESLGWI